MYVEKYHFMKDVDLGSSANWTSDPINGIIGKKTIMGARIIITCETGAGTIANIDYYFHLAGAQANPSSQGQPTPWGAAAATHGTESTIYGTTHSIWTALTGRPLHELDELKLLVVNDGTAKTGINGYIYLYHEV